MATEYKLLYFNIKVLGEPIRFVFHAAGVPFEDVRMAEDSDYQKLKWGLLPILEFDGIQISESCAITRFLANKFGMAGETPLESAQIDELVDVFKDVRLEWRKFYFENDETKKSVAKENLLKKVYPKYIPMFENIIQDNGSGWLVGKKYSWADFFLATCLEVWEDTIDADLLKDFPRLQGLKKGVFEIPGIASYLETRPKTDI